MQLSEHFTLDEATHSDTAIRQGIDNQPSTVQLENMKVAAASLEKVRALTGALNINSWLRLPAVNVAVGGSKVSSHMDGWAIDVSSSKHTPYELCKMVKESGLKFDQMIHEFGRWMHISFAPEMRQQELTIFKPEGKYKAGILTEAEYHKA
ncbi:Peptidase M15A, C-terminal [uncultured Caudovirales phage]|uniref:Peptidase M15A, C-terminal n=1 Tax=uncultured Caudovirales phage TaxID=2100421 RepID=A0A6J7WVB2_9CAUD|nr:Peptidase M15A, C-terminal [uncultured Caudovirales phage]CAB5222049.1 Peptidase M15A, C-terminal [uncultured Caudovirales phage]